MIGALAMGFVYIAISLSGVRHSLGGWYVVIIALPGLLTPMLWGLATYVAPYGRPDRIDSNDYLKLRHRLLSVKARLKATPDDAAHGDAACQSACREAHDASEALCAFLKKPRIEWTLRTGYIYAWSLVHKAEEALIDCACIPDCDVLEEAKYDLDRVKGSGMTNEESLSYQLQLAIREIDPQALVYVKNQIVIPATGDGASDDEEGTCCKTRPRAMAREARRALNAFRSDQYEGLLRARASLIRMISWTGGGVFLLTLLAIMVGAKATSLATALGLGILGALVGAFGRLYRQGNVKFQVEDLGLYSMQRVGGIVASAVAAILGVLLTVTLFYATLHSALTISAASSSTTPTPTGMQTPASSPAPASGTRTTSVQLEPISSRSVITASPTPVGEAQPEATSPATIPSLDDVFNLQETPLSPILAAIFGLLPSLVLTTLQQEASRFQTNLLKTEPTTQANGQS
jgi:hypothetical protein